jgi:ATP-dependent Clp protease, protease subunit
MNQLDCKNEEEKDGDKGTPLGEKLIKSRTILLSKGVDDKMVESVEAQLIIMESDDTKSPITFYINSPGGSADCGFAIFDLMNFVESPIITICSGICASAAILIFLGGAKGKRYSLSNSRFLLHQPSTQAQGTASDLQITAQEIVKLRSRYNEIVSAEVGQTVDKITQDSARDFWLTAQEAHQYGLVSKIITSRKEAI